MVKAILGKKIGMTQTFDEDGNRIPLTLVEAGPCVVLRKRTADKDGYSAIQVGFETIAKRKVTKPLMGQFGKEGPFRYIREFRLDQIDGYEVGQQITADVFAKGDLIDVSGTSRGKGFQGTIKRHNFHRGPMTHGSKNKRAPGSIGCSAYPSRVVKGKKLPGQMGNVRATDMRLTVYDVDVEKNLLLVRGAVPGGKNGLLEVRFSSKQKV